MPPIVAALACCYCGLILGILAYIVAGIYFMVVDRYVCADTEQDMLWLYAILVLTLPIGFQFVLTSTVHEDSTFTRLTATGTAVLGFIIYASYVIFGNNVCAEQIDKGGLYIWVLIQYAISIFCFVVLLYVITNPKVLESLSPGAAADKYREPLLSRPSDGSSRTPTTTTTTTSTTAAQDDVETAYQEAGID